MKKKLKEKFTAFETSLYNLKWVEKAATDGYKEFLEIFNDSIPNPDLRIKPENDRFAMIYYGAFEHALNTFFEQVLEDGMTQIELSIKEWDKVTALENKVDNLRNRIENEKK